MCRRNNVKLLYYNKEVFGVAGAYDSQNPERRSNARHSDYHKVQHLWDKNYRPNPLLPNPLPNPFNKGDAWNAEAIPIIESSISQFESMKDWKQFWIHTNLFNHNQEHFERFEDQYLWEL
jgi:hypothetical protein